ncbi:hypothetical protein CUJ84_Chr002591 [Rhizobium leguminosarum]|uniref:Uncharacterized protein n=1 Tax=Rhizobium leguminosarum TaxID=384 RepID=A0A2K9Z3Z7_RHILE|nr:hypothetical protein CUJ84_Chr002591 [Rhizobium leguminosarum]
MANFPRQRDFYTTISNIYTKDMPNGSATEIFHRKPQTLHPFVKFSTVRPPSNMLVKCINSTAG